MLILNLHSKTCFAGFLTLFFAIMTALYSPNVAAQDAKIGAKVFKKCKACHAVGEGAKNKIGPHLNKLFGRTAGTLEG